MRKRGKQFSTKRDPNLLMRMLYGVKHLDKEQQTDLGIAYRISLQSLRTGIGKEADFHTIACTINIALVLSEIGYSTEHAETIKDAQNGLMRCLDRGHRTGRWGLDGPAITSITYTLALHDEQISIATQRDILDAIAEVNRRIKNGKIL